MKHKISKYNLDDVKKNDRVKFNVNNMWINGEKPIDYDQICELCKTYNWINLFHKDIFKLSISGFELQWIKEAFDIGCFTKKFPKMYKEELRDLLEGSLSPLQKYKNVLTQGYFVRTDKSSLKYGIHGPGPYDNMKKIIESLVTTTFSHACVDSTDLVCNLYFCKWLNLDQDKEFRVFVKNNKITAISSQNIYVINKWLNNFSELQINYLLDDLLQYFDKNIKHKLLFIKSYVMDIYYSGPNDWYFIEPNPFGKEYSSGSALFHWEHDYDLLYGLKNYIEFRYVSN